MAPHSLMILVSTATILASLASCDMHRAMIATTPHRSVYDAIIVPGFPFCDHQAKMNHFQRQRLLWAYHLYTTGRARHIIVSGGAVHTPYVEAEIFARFLTDLGVPACDIIIENKAEHSTENVFYSLELAHHLGLEHVAVATDPLQTMMLKYLLHQMDISMEYLPADTKLLKRIYNRHFDISIDPGAAFVHNFVPLKLRERRKERMCGTKGQRYIAIQGNQESMVTLTLK